MNGGPVGVEREAGLAVLSGVGDSSGGPSSDAPVRGRSGDAGGRWAVIVGWAWLRPEELEVRGRRGGVAGQRGSAGPRGGSARRRRR